MRKPLAYSYIAVSEDGGKLSQTIEVISGEEDLKGSTPTANQYYEFVKWYLDEACTQPVTDEYGTVDAFNHFTPHKNKLSETERNIFYAKFDKKVGDLTIDRSNAAEEDQVFVYEIENNATGEVIYVTVTGKGSTTIKDLPFGNYTVSQQKSWSWRYDDDPFSNFVHQESAETVRFAKAEQAEKWLNGNSGLIENKRV